MKKNYEKEFIDIYKKYNSKILRHIFFRVSNGDLAEDLMQETFYKTWIYLNKNNSVKELKSFVYMVANNLIIDHYRQKDKTPIPIENVSEKELRVKPQQIEEFDKKIKLKILKKNLSSLNSKQKEIINYRYFKNFSIDEICAITGKSPNYISVLIYQGTKELKEKMNSPH